MWLEKRFPGYATTENEHRSSNEDESSLSKTSPASNSGSLQPAKHLNFRNTITKFALDQTIGAAVNTILFIGGIALLRGKPFDEVVKQCQDQFWPLMYAGQKLWPGVSLTSFLLVPVEYRTTFGGIIGLFW